MVEEGWSKEQTISELVEKAGVSLKDISKVKNIKLTTYESS